MYFIWLKDTTEKENNEAIPFIYPKNGLTFKNKQPTNKGFLNWKWQSFSEMRYRKINEKTSSDPPVEEIVKLP